MANTSETSNNIIIVHHLNNSRSQRILWLLEELEVPYEIKKYQRTSEMLAPAEFKTVHPLGKSPVITDGKLTVAESGTIVEYLIHKYGNEKFKPTDAGWLDNLYFTHYAEGSLMPLLVNKLIFSVVPQHSPFFIRPVASVIFKVLQSKLVDPSLETHRKFIEERLAKSSTGWFADGPEPTAADFLMIFPMEGLQQRIVGPGKSKVLDEFVKKVHERPAWKRALEKGGEYSIL